MGILATSSNRELEGVLVAVMWRTQWVWDRTGAILDDVLVNTMHWWDPLDVGPVALGEALVGFWEGLGASSLRSYIPALQELREIRVYDVESVQADPEHIEASGAPGLGVSSSLPPQCAAAVTLVVPQRRHWGRNYWGQLIPTAISASGRLGDTVCDQINGSLSGMAATGDLEGYTLSVLERGTPFVQHTVTGFRTDNIVDIQRSRRYEVATYRAELP
jgi:hypothetical protein